MPAGLSFTPDTIARTALWPVRTLRVPQDRSCCQFPNESSQPCAVSVQALSPVFPAWAHPGKDVMLQPPKPQIRPSERILERIAGCDLHMEAAD